MAVPHMTLLQLRLCVGQWRRSLTMLTQILFPVSRKEVPRRSLLPFCGSAYLLHQASRIRPSCCTPCGCSVTWLQTGGRRQPLSPQAVQGWSFPFSPLRKPTRCCMFAWLLHLFQRARMPLSRCSEPARFRPLRAASLTGSLTGLSLLLSRSAVPRALALVLQTRRPLVAPSQASCGAARQYWRTQLTQTASWPPAGRSQPALRPSGAPPPDPLILSPSSTQRVPPRLCSA